METQSKFPGKNYSDRKGRNRLICRQGGTEMVLVLTSTTVAVLRAESANRANL